MAYKKSVTKALKKVKKKNKKLYYAIIVIAVIAVAAFLIWSYYNPYQQPEQPVDSDYISTVEGVKFGQPFADSGLRVHFIDVGQGDGIYIEFPDGRDMLIDGGSTKKSSNELLFTDGTSIRKKTASSTGLAADYIDYYDDDDELDYLLITHPDSDHYSMAASVLEKYQVNNALIPFATIPALESTSATAQEKESLEGGYTVQTKGYASFLTAVFDEPDCTVKVVLGCFTIEVGDVKIEIYSYEREAAEKVTDPNALSPVCVLSYAGRKVVLSGDAVTANEKYFTTVADSMDCDVLKAGHHGSNTSNSVEFLEFVNCEYAVISAGADNSYSHPHTEIVARFKADNMKMFVTFEMGCIVFTVDSGGNMAFYAAINPSVSAE